jgi:hypothetical protein
MNYSKINNEIIENVNLSEIIPYLEKHNLTFKVKDILNGQNIPCGHLIYIKTSSKKNIWEYYYLSLSGNRFLSIFAYIKNEDTKKIHNSKKRIDRFFKV